MFYCDECATRNAWPHPTLFRSRGDCEVCETRQVCNDMPSRLLPIPAPSTTAPTGAQ